MRAKLRYLIWVLLLLPALVPLFLGKETFITNFNSDGTARTSFPPYIVPILILLIVAAVEFYRYRLRARSFIYAEWAANGILLLIAAGMIYLDLANAKPEMFFK